MGVAPYKRLMHGDWISLERIINDLYRILNQDTTLAEMSDIVTQANAAIAALEAALAALDDVAGSDTQVQWNNEGDFGANANFTFDDATNILNLTGTIKTTRLLVGGVTE